MKRLPFSCRRCGQPCVDRGGQCYECDDRENRVDAAIARNFPARLTPATLFTHAGTTAAATGFDLPNVPQEAR